jgi:hypothetical protein
VRDVLKNELAGGVPPCGHYGAKAAWFRLAVITYNVLTAMKRLVLPPDLRTARPNRLRFLIFQQPGKLIQHARKTVLRLARTWNRFSNWKDAMEWYATPPPVVSNRYAEFLAQLRIPGSGDVCLHHDRFRRHSNVCRWKHHA